MVSRLIWSAAALYNQWCPPPPQTQSDGDWGRWSCLLYLLPPNFILSISLSGFFLVTLDDSRAGGSTDSGISGGSAGVSVMTGGGLEWTGSDGDSEGDELVGGLDGSVFKVWADLSLEGKVRLKMLGL